METVWKPRCTVDVEIPADCICSVSLQCLKRIDRISLGLAHLLSVLILYVTKHNNVFVWCFVENQSRNRKQRVKPSTRLVYRLRDKVCRELLLEQIFILKWIMMLCKWHRTTVKPAVDYLRYTMHRLAAFRASDRHFINIWAMKLNVIRTVIGHGFQFLDTSDGMLMSALTLPDIQRSSPVTVTADSPVLYILEPVTETSFSDAFRDPVDCIVVCDQIILYFCHLNEPGLSRIVDQRSITSPAVRVAVLKFRSIKQKASLIQVFKYHRIRFLYKHTAKWCIVCHVTFAVNKLNKRHIVFFSDLGVILTKRRSDMNNTGTVCQRYITITGNVERFLMLFFSNICRTLIQRLIFFVFQIFTCVSFQNFISRLSFLCMFAEYRIQQSRCHIVSISIRAFYFSIFLIRIDTKSDIGRKCPWCCCPCQNVGIFLFYFEANDCGTLFYIFIALCDFLCGKRSTAAWAVRYDFESLVQKAFLPDLFQSPPLRFDEIVVISNIWIVHISPEANCT